MGQYQINQSMNAFFKHHYRKRIKKRRPNNSIVQQDSRDATAYSNAVLDSPEGHKDHQRKVAEKYFLQKVDRILSGKLDVYVSNDTKNGVAPAYTYQGKYINIKDKYFCARQPEDWMLLKGLNYHELAHVMLTPLMKGALDSDRDKKMYNMLEDCRIESQLTRKFDVLRDYYSAIVSKFIMNAPTFQVGNDKYFHLQSFFLLFGRIYLPKKIRTQSFEDIKEIITDENDQKELKNIIRCYISLDTAGIVGRAKGIIKRIFEILDKYIPPMEQDHMFRIEICSGGHGSKMKPGDRKKLAKEVKEKTEWENEKEEKEEQEKEEDKQSDNPQEDVPDLSETEIDGNGERGENDGGDDSQSDEQSEQEEKGKDEQDNPIEKISKLKEAMQKELEKAQKNLDKELNKDLAEITASAGESRGTSYGFGSVTQEMKTNRDRLIKMLEHLKSNPENRWYQRRLKSGNVNMRDAMKLGHDGDLRVFKRFNPNMRHKVPRVAILIDRSGSMDGTPIDIALQAGWVFSSAYQRLGILPAIWTFNTDSEKIVGENSHIKEDIYLKYSAGGGTNPNPALKEAIDFLEQSPGLGMLVIITDGCWDMGNHGEQLIKSFSGISVQVGIGMLHEHGCTYEFQIKSVTELITELTKRVIRMQRNIFERMR